MQFSDTFEFNCPVKVLCGKRALEHIPYELEALNARKPLLLCDEDAARENRGRAVADALRESNMVLGVVDPLPAGVDLDLVHQVAAIYRDKDCDALLAMGTGSLVDTVKLVNLVVSTGQDDPNVFAGVGRIQERLKPMALIAPAAATGYEAAGRAQAGKTRWRSLTLMPDLLIIDQRTIGAPGAEALVESGLTALAFGAEAVLDPEKLPMADIYAANAVQMAVASLIRAPQTPDAVDVRMAAANAAAMAGCTLADKAPGRLHRLGRQLSASGRVSPGKALGILLPGTVGYGALNWCWAVADLLRPLVGLDRFACTPAAQRPLAVITALTHLVNGLFDDTEGRIPRTLQDVGFNPEDLAPLAEAASGAPNGPDRHAALTILTNALDGRPIHPDY
ncbi:MAG: iron-containing alcohol dehydrogenase [Desulfosarcina sp.]|nr:iron-containing alcohol dehydrogenase [Desulfobacterales bacterium]